MLGDARHGSGCPSNGIPQHSVGHRKDLLSSFPSKFSISMVAQRYDGTFPIAVGFSQQGSGLSNNWPVQSALGRRQCKFGGSLYSIQENRRVSIWGFKMSGDAAQNKSRFERKEVLAVSHYLPSVMSRQNAAEGTNREKGPLSSKSAEVNTTGFVLLDATLRPLYANQEALSALIYPTNFSKNNDSDSFFVSRVQALLEESKGFRHLKSVSFASGRRRYHLRVFSVRSPIANGSKPAFAILVERSKKPTIDLSDLSKRFRLTKREVETVEHLVQGFNTQQIAERMSISPNTVKAFLRSIMMKMAVDSRAGIIARILQE